MDTAQILYEISKTDLKSANLLFYGKCYPQAVYFLQQSTEKATKSFALKQGIIKENELNGRNGIGHKPLEIYKRILDEALKIFHSLENVGGSLEFNSLTEKMNIEHKGLEGLFKQIDELNQEKVSKLSTTEIEGLINEFYTYVQNISELSSFKFPNNFFEMANNLPANLGLAESSLDDSDDFDMVKNEMIKNKKVVESAVHTLFDLSYVFLALLYLSIITHGHSTVTRYPVDYNPLEYYTEDSPIIIHFKQIMVIMEETLNKMDRLFPIPLKNI